MQAYPGACSLGPGLSSVAMRSDLRQEILSILEDAQDLTLATLRQDGYPQATTVSYASDGLTIYFGCGVSSQKAINMMRDDRVSLTVNLPYERWADIRGLSMGGRAEKILDRGELERASQLLIHKFPAGIAEYASDMEGVAFFRIRPEIISVLDYRKGFGHTELVKAADVQG
jgi:general stress protein 26